MKKLFILAASLIYLLPVNAQDAVLYKLPNGITPTIDGIVDNLWDSVEVHNIDKNFTGETPSFSSATWQAVWNDTAIFVIVRVKDDFHCDQWCSGDQGYFSDKVELYVDVNSILKDGQGPAVANNGHYQFAPEWQQSVNQYYYNGTDWRGNLFSYGYKITGSNYVYEYLIPISTLKDKNGDTLIPAPSKLIGFDVYSVDRDSSNDVRRRAVWKNDGIINESWYDMDDCGTISLSSTYLNVTNANVYGGNVSGTWTKSASPYKIYGDITIPVGSTLTIESGVQILFQGYYKINVNGVLRANGVRDDSIYFMKSVSDTAGLSNVYSTNGGWNGINWINTGSMNGVDSSIVNYCVFKYSKSNPGGAVQVISFPKVKFINCRFYRNYTSMYGGAAYLRFLDDVYINKCTFEENSSSSLGGAIFYELWLNTAQRAEITNCNFYKNIAAGKGGAIYLNQVKSNLLINNCTFYGNIATNGGALYSDVGSTPVTILNSNFSWNKSTGDGGAIYFNFGGVTLQNCLINNNYSGSNAGAIFFATSDDFIGNCIIANNKSAIDGGAFIIKSSSPVFVNNSIVNNTGSFANYAGITFWDYSAAEFYNNIIWGNASTTGTARQISIWQSEEMPIFKNCIIQKGTIYSDLTIQNNVQFIDTIGWNPLFVSPTASADIDLDASLANWRIKNTSPAINKGIKNYQTIKLQKTDFYSQNRIMNGIIDIGASEIHIGKITVQDTIKTNTIWVADTILVANNIYIKDSVTLTISPWATVIFDSSYKIKIAGTLKAVGDKDKPIKFTVSDTSGFSNKSNNTGGWLGLDFNNDAQYWDGADGAMNDNDTSYIQNCVFEYAKFTGTDYLGGAINVRFFSRLVVSDCLFKNNVGNWGGAVFLGNQSGPIIKNNVFSNNYAINEGGAIAIKIKSKPLIMNNLITNNYGYFGGGLAIYASDPLVVDNIITNNHAVYGGGLVNHYFGSPIIINNNITYNYAEYGGGIQAWDGAFNIYNTVIWENQSSVDGHEISTDDYGVNFFNCNIKDYTSSGNYKGAWNDTSNIFSIDPAFIKEPVPPDYTGNGLNADFHITPISGNIDKGTLSLPAGTVYSTDIYGNKRINNEKIDVGAVEDQHSKLIFTSQPTGGSICEDDSVILSVSASDTAIYQWQKDGSNITGATKTSYVITHAKQYLNQGNYVCIASNAYGKVFSTPVFIQVRKNPTITEQPEGGLISLDETYRLDTRADGDAPLYYQWYKNSTILTGDSLFRLQIDSFKLKDEGVYYCTVSNVCSSITSNPVKLSLAPQICLVTARDSTANIIVFEKGSNISYQKFNIYREGTTLGYYEKLSSVSSLAPGVYVDSIDPREQAYLYKITGVRSNNTETDINLCQTHKTMHLRVSKGVPTGYQLDWDEYLGFKYSTYYIFRSTDGGKNFDTAHVMSSSTRSWTDYSAPSGYLLYYVQVEKGDNCYPNGSKKGGSDIYSQSASNMEDNRLKSTDIANIVENNLNLTCYPNPYRDITTITYNLQEPSYVILKVYNLLGEKIATLINEKQYPGNNKFRFAPKDYGLSSGIYILQLKAENKLSTIRMMELR